MRIHALLEYWRVDFRTVVLEMEATRPISVRSKDRTYRPVAWALQAMAGENYGRFDRACRACDRRCDCRACGE